MKHLKWRVLLLCFVLFNSIFAFAKNSENTLVNDETAVVQNILSLSAPQADWVFSGIVANESDEHYYYYFQMHRENKQFHAIALLVDAQTNKQILFEESDAFFERPKTAQWLVGRTFLHYNAINNSWVFGVKDKDKKGFNFKVDMMGLGETVLSKQQDLYKGISLRINQTGRLNGHVQTGHDKKEEFVTAKKAWFRQLWVSKPEGVSHHPLTAILCEFNDGAGFYAVNLNALDALHGSLAGWRDAQGKAIAMSQFVSAKENKEGLWQIHITSPKMTLVLSNLVGKTNSNYLIAGVVKKDLAGFCAISKHEIGNKF